MSVLLRYDTITKMNSNQKLICNNYNDTIILFLQSIFPGFLTTKTSLKNNPFVTNLQLVWNVHANNFATMLFVFNAISPCMVMFSKMEFHSYHIKTIVVSNAQIFSNVSLR